MAACTLCKRSEVFFLRPYSGERLCEKCFCRSIEKKVRATISKYEMLNHDDRIAIAVSGGKDSVSLLHILAKIERDFPRTSLCAITVDEGIKGYRDEAVKIAAENCAKLRVKQITVFFKELYGYTLDEVVEKTKDGELTPCAYCGVLRRRALNIAARRAGADKIATAHNLDDEIQTFLLNIIHGDPLRIIRSEPTLDLEASALIQRVKPFCEVLEREIALYAYVKGIRFQEMPCLYAGAALRNDVRNVLNRLDEKHPSIKYTVYSSMEKIRQAMKEMATKIPLKTCKNCGEPTTGTLCQTCQILRDFESHKGIRKSG